MRTILNFMGRDHDRLDDLFEQFRRAMQNDKNKAKGLFREFNVGLQQHIIWEEEILFPLFEDKTRMRDTGPTAVMRMEHRKIQDFLGKIHEKFIKGEEEGLEEGFVDVLAEHNNKEEKILYPWIDNSVSEEEKEEAFTRMQHLFPEKYNHCCES